MIPKTPKLDKIQEEFIKESNKIEGIIRKPTVGEIREFQRFMELREVTVQNLKIFVAAYQRDALLRDKPGMNVYIGEYTPPKGGPDIRKELELILADANGGRCTPYMTHQRYEHLHPFMDGNGRSGRMLWYWMMGGSRIGFLHKWYYQSLSTWRQHDMSTDLVDLLNLEKELNDSKDEVADA